MRDFKFLQIPKRPRVRPGIIKLKDIHNRNKIMLITWSEFPYDGDDSHIRTFQGNILQFYNYVRHLPHGVTIYEIFKRCGGYFDDSIVYGTENRYNQFIARKFQLTIHYTI